MFTCREHQVCTHLHAEEADKTLLKITILSRIVQIMEMIRRIRTEREFYHAHRC